MKLSEIMPATPALPCLSATPAAPTKSSTLPLLFASTVRLPPCLIVAASMPALSVFSDCANAIAAPTPALPPNAPEPAT